MLFDIHLIAHQIGMVAEVGSTCGWYVLLTLVRRRTTIGLNGETTDRQTRVRHSQVNGRRCESLRYHALVFSFDLLLERYEVLLLASLTL